MGVHRKKRQKNPKNRRKDSIGDMTADGDSVDKGLYSDIRLSRPMMVERVVLLSKGQAFDLIQFVLLTGQSFQRTPD